jgi:hypothetical protein
VQRTYRRAQWAKQYGYFNNRSYFALVFRWMYVARTGACQSGSHLPALGLAFGAADGLPQANSTAKPLSRLRKCLIAKDS